MEVECEGFTFTSKFDAGNLAQVECVPKCKSASNGKATPSATETPDYEFNLWTKPDCAGTEFENGNRTWFYFGIKGGAPFALVKLNIVNLNRQAKLFSEGMSPVYRIVPGRPNWERIHDKPTFAMEQKRFVLSFKYRTLENLRATTYFAFTYPYSYSDLQNSLRIIDTKCEPYKKQYEETKDINTIYYHRECVCWSLEQRRVELLTLSSHHGISTETEPRLKHLFPETNIPRALSFPDKKVVFISARVHPGETPSSFVLSGMLNYLLQPHDPVAQLLRKLFVFKFIPTLNPDGQANGHYRTDTRGVNLNRVYLNPSLVLHPSIYAARSLIRYYHYGCEMPEEDLLWDTVLYTTSESSSPELAPISDIKSKVSVLSLADSDSSSADGSSNAKPPSPENARPSSEPVDPGVEEEARHSPEASTSEPPESGIFMYIDLHGHASKKGVFMYGNHFENIEDSIECMLLPKIVSLNNSNFHFTACNFTKRNMYLRDRRDGMSREGSGRVAVFKLTGLVRSYTLECNYNTGRLVNSLPPTSKDSKPSVSPVVPPKYTPQIFEEVGRALAVSVLDLAGSNPWSRVRSSEFRGLPGLRDWLRRYVQTEQSAASRPPPLRRPSVQVTSAGCASAGSSSLPGALEPASRPRAKTHHLAPLAKSRPDPAEDSEKKENLATSSLALEQTVKIKSPMSPRENLAQLPSPRFSKSSSKPPLLTNKATSVQKHDGTSKNLNTNGRVTKIRRSTEKLSNKQVLTGAIVSGETGLTKINRSLSIEKGESSTNKGVQVLKQGPKRLKISAIKSDASSNKVNQGLIEGDGSTSTDSTSSSINCKKIQKIISLSATKCEDQNIWSRIEETPTKPSWKSSLSRPSLKLSPRKLSAQANLAGPSSAPSSRLEAAGGSSKLVRHNRSSQLRATHLLPIKSSHKSSITKKKSLDWEKKRGKSSFKNLPINKKSTTCEDQLALENLHNKSKPKVKGELF